MKNNPWKVGSTAYIAYECGYSDALEEVQKIWEETSYGGDHKEKCAAGVSEHHEE